MAFCVAVSDVRYSVRGCGKQLDEPRSRFRAVRLQKCRDFRFARSMNLKRMRALHGIPERDARGSNGAHSKLRSKRNAAKRAITHSDSAEHIRAKRNAA